MTAHGIRSDLRTPTTGVTMYFIGIDPGSIYTGLAILSSDVDTFDFHHEYDDPIKLWLDLLSFGVLDHPCRIALEDMLGSGRRDTNIVRTIKAVGYFQYRFREYGILNSSDLVVELIPQQARLAYVSLVPKKITGKDEISAAAHALAIRERNRNVLFDIERVLILSGTSASRTPADSSVQSCTRAQLYCEDTYRDGAT